MVEARREAVVTALAAALAVAWVVGRYGSFQGLAEAMDYAPQAFVDFIYVYLPAGRAIFEDPEPVRGFFYTPFFALLMAIPAALPARAALSAWVVLQLAAVAALALLAPRASATTRPWLRVAVVPLTILAFPVLHGLSWGQVSAPLVALLLGAIVLDGRLRGWCSPALLALGAAVKYYSALGVLPFAARLRGRLVARTVALTLLFAFVLPAFVLGPAGVVAFYADVLAMIQASEQLVREDVNSQHVANVVSRWLHASSEEAGATYLAGRAVGLAAATGIAVAAIFVARRLRGAEGLGASMALALLATPFWVPTSWPHYFAYLPFAQLAAASLILGRPGSALRRALLGLPVGVAALATMAPVYQLFGKEAASEAGVLFVANLLVLVPLLVASLAAARGSQAAGSALRESGPGRGRGTRARSRSGA
jgi:hypothetical protein